MWTGEVTGGVSMWSIETGVRFHQPLGPDDFWSLRLSDSKRVTIYAAAHRMEVDVPRFDRASLDQLTTAVVDARNELRSATAATAGSTDAGPK